MDGGGSGTSRLKSYVALQVIWLALMISVLIYVVVAFTLTNSSGFTAPQVPVRTMFLALAVVSLLLFPLQVFLRSFLSDTRLFPRILKKIRAANTADREKPDIATFQLFQGHSNYSLIIWALGEIPAIFGLVLTFMSGDIRFVAGFALYSILNMFVFRPKGSKFEDQLGRLSKYLLTRGQGK